MTAKDVRLDDDHELFAANAAPDTTATTTNAGSTKHNPYLKKNEWHGGEANAELAAATTTTTTTTTGAASQPNNNALSMLMAGAQRAAQTTATTKLGSAAPLLNQMLMAGARWAAKTAHIQQNNHRKEARSAVVDFPRLLVRVQTIKKSTTVLS